MTGGGTVEGAVLGFDGTALRGAGLTLTDAGGRQVDRTLADDAGRFRLVAPAAGSHLLICAVPGFGPSVARVELTGTVVRRDVVISGDCSLSGRVRDGDTPVPATVTLIDGTGTAVGSLTTGRRGTFSFDGLRAGHYVLAASIDGAEADVQTVKVAGDERVEIVLDRSGSLGGTVRGPDGIPLAEATVVLRSADGRELARAGTGPDGRFDLTKLPPGTHTLTASVRTVVHTEVNTSIPTELDVSVPPPREPVAPAAPDEWHRLEKPEAGRRRARRGRAPFRK